MTAGKSVRQPRSFHGQRESALRNEVLRRRAPAGVAGRVLPPSVEATRRAVMAGICPFCGRGPFLVLAGHTQKVHGVDRFELRELADLTYSTSLLDERTREAFSQRAKARLALGVPLPSSSGVRKKRRLSPAGKRIQAEKLLRLAEQLGPEGLARQRTAAAQRKGELSRKPHPCPACGTILPTAHPITCSPACRRVIRVRTARASAAKRLARGPGPREPLEPQDGGVVVSGRLGQREWTSSDGSQHARFEVVADDAECVAPATTAH